MPVEMRINTSLPERKLVGVVLANGIYKEYEGRVYRHTFYGYPPKKQQNTGFINLQQVLDLRDEAKPIFEGDSVTLFF